LQHIISLVAVFFVRWTPIPYKLEHCSMSTGTLFHIIRNKIPP